jgi:hypothetical protein
MDEFSVQIDTKDLEEKLKALPEAIAKRYMKTALEAAGEVILAPMVALAPERTDEPTPEGTGLPPGILKYDLHTQVILNDSGGKVRVGPSDVAGHVASWQNNGWMLTKGGYRQSNSHKNGTGKALHEVPGKHFMEGAYDEAAEAALDTFIATLAEELSGDQE